MTTTLTWEDAIRQVLTEAGEPMHYRDITADILERGLVATVGKTPSATVRNAIYRMIARDASTDRPPSIKWVAPGIFGLSGAMDTETIARPIDEETVLVTEGATPNLSVAAYGLHWERDKVDWANGRILGYDTDPKQPIDFASQQGVYLLHNWQSTVYVGMTTAEENGLSQRLRYHHRRADWSGKWERFSWFGVRQVDEDGNMVDGPDNATRNTVVALMETLLIEVLGPALNKNQGDYRGNLYRQVIDPNIAREQAQEILRRVVLP